MKLGNVLLVCCFLGGSAFAQTEQVQKFDIQVENSESVLAKNTSDPLNSEVEKQEKEGSNGGGSLILLFVALLVLYATRENVNVEKLRKPKKTARSSFKPSETH